MSSALKDTEESRAFRSIRQFLSSESGVHAVMFYGAEGAPLVAVADELAKGWLCTDLQQGRACGRCRSCMSFERSNSVDLKVIRPKGASRVIKISAITFREEEKDEEPYPLQDFFQTAPIASKHKVAIIRDADRLNHNAANALLKILEEPHPYAKMILTTHVFSSMIPTVVSRCVNVPVELEGEPEVNVRAKEILNEILDLLQHPRPELALHLTEKLRDMSAAIEHDTNQGARFAHSSALVLLGNALFDRFPHHPEWAQAIAEAHRRIVGNASATLAFDALFTRITS